MKLKWTNTPCRILFPYTSVSLCASTRNYACCSFTTISSISISSDLAFSTARWTRIVRISRCPERVLVTSYHRTGATISSDTGPNGYRQSVAPSTRALTSNVVLSVVCGKQRPIVARRAKHVINGLRVSLKYNSKVPGSSDSAPKLIIVLIA